MQFTEAKMGRAFVLRLHDGDHLPNVLEEFASQNKVCSALCFFVGGAKKDSHIVVGPKGDGSLPVEPAVTLLSGVSEMAGIGTIFTNEEGKPTLHMHASFGRGEKALTGCVRQGVDVWLIGEVIILELITSLVQRVVDKNTGFELLETGK
jgi:predicted DNA-binding protein with PD1-like motif